jgi:hypothetical protein
MKQIIFILFWFSLISIEISASGIGQNPEITAKHVRQFINKGNQYYRTFEIAPNQKPFIDYDPIRRSHYPSKSGGVMTYLDLFNIIENGFTTSEPPPLHFPSHMSPRPFIEDFRNHVKDTLAERFARECASQGVDIDIGSIIVE